MDCMQTHFGSPYEEILSKKTCKNCKHHKYLDDEDEHICTSIKDEFGIEYALNDTIEDCQFWEDRA